MLKYGDRVIEYCPDRPYHTVLPDESAAVRLSESEIISHALARPYNATPISERSLAGQKICVIVSDITRAWQRMAVFLPFILAELEKSGAAARDVTLLFALGSHRKQTEAEQRALVGDAVYEKYTCIDHDCKDMANMRYVGTTTRGVPVHINRLAADADFLVICGGVVFHDMAGFGGGRKSILPGVSAYETIMGNHAYALNQDGPGIHPEARQNNRQTNPLSLDMEEAADMVRPDFLFNVIIDEDKITAAYAGDYKTAFDAGCEALAAQCYIPIPQLYDLVVASAGGFPNDINYYQGTKALSNASHAVKPGGTVLLFCEAREGLGHPEMDEFYRQFVGLAEMEAYLRQHFTVARFISYLAATEAARYTVKIVAAQPFPLLTKHGIQVFTTAAEAWASIRLPAEGTLCVMPEAAKTLPYVNGLY